MRKRRLKIGRYLLLLMLLAGIGLAFRQGLVPARYSPLPALDLERPLPLIVDWQLAELRFDAKLCSRVLVPPHIESVPIRDNPLNKGCGWINSVRVSSVGGARLPVDKLSCPAAAALSLWMVHQVQPLAQSMFGQRVKSLEHMGTYSCRNIVGNAFWKNKRSEHATANAIDISAFTLEDGKRISVLKDWRGQTPEAEFLRLAHAGACNYFRVALGPEFNRAHRDHFHLDRGILSTCK
jgi:hypothetical protein